MIYLTLYNPFDSVVVNYCSHLMLQPIKQTGCKARQCHLPNYLQLSFHQNLILLYHPPQLSQTMYSAHLCRLRCHLATFPQTFCSLLPFKTSKSLLFSSQSNTSGQNIIQHKVQKDANQHIRIRRRPQWMRNYTY